MLPLALGLELDGLSVLQVSFSWKFCTGIRSIGVDSPVLGMTGKARKKPLRSSYKVTKLNWLKSLLKLACMVMAGNL
jgi:hypothetical protein